MGNGNLTGRQTDNLVAAFALRDARRPMKHPIQRAPSGVVGWRPGCYEDPRRLSSDGDQDVKYYWSL